MTARYRIVALILGLSAVIGRLATCSRDVMDAKPVAQTNPTGVATFQRSIPPAEMPTNSTVGVVHLAKVYAAHPLSAVIAADDRQLLTIRLSQADDGTVADQAEIIAAEKRLQGELQAAAIAAQAGLKAHGQELTDEEHRQMTALIKVAQQQAAHAGAASTVIAQTDRQISDLAAQQHREFANGISAEQHAVIDSVKAGLDTQDEAALETKAAKYSQDESAFAINIAQRDTDTLVGLRVRLANLKLSDADRVAAIATLNGLQHGEQTAIEQKKNDDLRALSLFADDLRSHRAIAATAITESMETAGKGALEVDAVNAALPTPAPPPAALQAASPAAALRAKLENIHRTYQARFDQDEKASVAAFQAKRAQFQAQLESLRSAHGQQQQLALQNYQRVNAARAQVHASMNKDIQRVINQVAAAHHVSMVIVDPLATGANVVDLTPEIIARLPGEAR